jgi:ketosteroid isomerase-like protein
MTHPTATPRTEMDRLIADHYRAELAGDGAAAVAMFALHIEHDAVGFPRISHGRAAAAAFYADLFAHLAFDRLIPRRRLYGDGFCVDEATVEARAIGHPFGFEGRGRSVHFRLLHIFEFAHGQITRETTWPDLAAIARQLA